MSAWIVSTAHIDLLVHALTVTELVAEDPDVIGRELWRENHRSVNYLYAERWRTPSYEFKAPTAYRNDPSAWMRARNCYAYQSCEGPEWTSSRACRWMADLHTALVAIGVSEHGAYPWGFEESDVRPRVAA